MVERVGDNGDDETTAMTSLISLRSFIDESEYQGRATATPPFSPRGVCPTTCSVGKETLSDLNGRQGKLRAESVGRGQARLRPAWSEAASLNSEGTAKLGRWLRPVRSDDMAMMMHNAQVPKRRVLSQSAIEERRR